MYAIVKADWQLVGLLSLLGGEQVSEPACKRCDPGGVDCPVRPTFCRHQKLLTKYHSNFLIWVGSHTIDPSLFGSAPDFLLPPCTAP